MTLDDAHDPQDFERLLARCGVDSSALSPRERTALDEEGWLVLHGMLPARSLEPLRETLELELATAPQTPASRQRGTRHVAELPWKDELYDVAYTHPRLLAAVHHVLRRPFRVFQLSARDPQRGFGLQGLHTDWLPKRPGEPDRVVSALWLLDDFLPRNGATRVVPRTHRLPQPLPKALLRPEAHHPQELLVQAPAGAVLVFNGHLYHGGTLNLCGAPRRVLQCQFVAREALPPGQPAPQAPARLPEAVRRLLTG